MTFLLKPLAFFLSCLFLASSSLHAGQPLPGSPDNAASAASLPEGTLFKLKVTGVFIHGGKQPPAWIPKLRKGQSVKVRIGPEGKLILVAPRFGIPLKKEFRNSNSYERPVHQVGRAFRTAAATLLTKPSGSRSKLILTFNDTFFKDPGQLPVDLSVVYELN